MASALPGFRLSGVGRGAPAWQALSLDPAKIERIISEAIRPPKATVQRIWTANEIKPHRTRLLKLSNDPAFEQKFWDVIGVYLNPPIQAPVQALILCCDEKSQGEALERTQPGLPLGHGHIQTQNPRLLSAWDYRPLCCPQLPQWESPGHRAHPATAIRNG
jgi:hypothetical protein